MLLRDVAAEVVGTTNAALTSVLWIEVGHPGKERADLRRDFSSGGIARVVNFYSHEAAVASRAVPFAGTADLSKRSNKDQ